MKTSIFNEDFVRVHAGNNYAGKIDAGAIALQCLRIGTRTARVWIKTDTNTAQEFRIGRVARQSENEIVF